MDFNGESKHHLVRYDPDNFDAASGTNMTDPWCSRTKLWNSDDKRSAGNMEDVWIDLRQVSLCASATLRLCASCMQDDSTHGMATPRMQPSDVVRTGKCRRIGG